MSRASVWIGASAPICILLLGQVAWLTRSYAQDAQDGLDVEDTSRFSSHSTFDTGSDPTLTPSDTSLLPPSASYDASAPANTSASAGLPPVVLSTREELWGKTHVLGDHVFTIGAFTPTALVLSYVGVRAGLEYHQVPGFTQLPTLTNSATPTPVNLRTLNVTESFDFGIKLHDYVGLFGTGYGNVRIGANAATLLGTGADYAYGGELGVLVKLFRIRGFQLSASGQIGAFTGQSAGISALFQDLNAIARQTVEQVQTNPNFDVNSAINQLNSAFRTAATGLLTPFDGVRYGFALSGALALGRFVGLQGSIGYRADNAVYRPTRYDATVGGPVTTRHTVTITRPSFGIAADVDVNPVGVPLALLVEYRATPVDISDTQPTVADISSLEHLIAVGLFYSGRTDLQLGLTGYTLFGQPSVYGADATPSGKPLDLAVQLVFRYYW